MCQPMDNTFDWGKNDTSHQNIRNSMHVVIPIQKTFHITECKTNFAAEKQTQQCISLQQVFPLNPAEQSNVDISHAK